MQRHKFIIGNKLDQSGLCYSNNAISEDVAKRVAQICRFYGDELNRKKDTSSSSSDLSPSLFAHNLINIPERLGGSGAYPS